MSGKPWPGGADRIVAILERIGEISPRATSLKKTITEAQIEYDTLNDEYRTLQKEMSDLMNKMDLSSVGNQEKT